MKLPLGDIEIDIMLTEEQRKRLIEALKAPDEVDIFILPDIFRSIGPGDDVVVSAEKLRNYIAREISIVVGKNERTKEVIEFLSIRGLSDNAKKAVRRDELRVEQRQRAVDRGWRIG